MGASPSLQPAAAAAAAAEAARPRRQRRLSSRLDQAPSYASCTSQCSVIQDVENGWDGFCLGLQRWNANTTRLQCRRACCEDAECEVWQWGNPRDQFGNSLGSCYTGRGLYCSSDRLDNFLVEAGQRITHGTVSDVIPLEKGRWCTGRGMRQATHVRSVEKCKDVCYNDPQCSVWEHSTREGCWYGYYDACLLSPQGETMVDGEKVARACKMGDFHRRHTDYVQVFGIIGAVAFFFTCSALAVLLCGAAGGKDANRAYVRRSRFGFADEAESGSE